MKSFTSDTLITGPFLGMPTTTCATMSVLAVTAGRAGDVVILRGYWAADDGGGGWFMWQAGNNTGNNGGTVVVVGTGRWLRLDTGPVNVRWFGAKGDDVADDYAPIWAAIVAATSYTGPATGVSGSVYFPNGKYLIGTKIDYVGQGQALNLIGEQGGLLVGGTQLRWIGAAGGTMLELRGVWRGTVENIEFEGRSIAGTCVWVHSNQPAGGAGFQGYVFRKCGFYDINGLSADPVVFRVGDVAGGTYQVDLTKFEHCVFRGDVTNPGTATCWRVEQGGNTTNFAFYDCDFYNGQYGINAFRNSGTLLVEDCYFAEFTTLTPLLPETSSCIVVSSEGRATITACNVQNTGQARFINCIAMGSTGTNGLLVQGCLTYMESPTDHVVISYVGQLTLISNAFAGAVTNILTITPKIIAAPLIIDATNPAGTPPSTVVSISNHYGYSPGPYAPFINSAGTSVIGPAGVAAIYGAQQSAVTSMGDTVSQVGTTPLALRTWNGKLPAGSVFTPAVIGGNTDNYAPAGYQGYDTWRLAASGAFNVTGIIAGADGDVLKLYNVGAFNITIKNNDGASLAANRVVSTADIVLAPNAGCTLTYDATTDVWRCIGLS